MTPWDKYYEEENARIERIFNRGFYGETFPIAPAPTRAETIKAAWADEGERHWAQLATGEGLCYYHDLGIIEPILFEQKRYGDVWVIEAEGVVVHRLPIR